MSSPKPRQTMSAVLTDRVALPGFDVRPVVAEDAAALGRLMYCAYVDTIDYDGETETQAVAEVRKTFDGEYGPFDWASSGLIELEGVAVSAALITRWQGNPFVAFSMTEPGCKNKGYARACLVRAMHLLRSLGEHELSLVVTMTNNPAVSLYEGLGFVAAENAA